MVRRRSPAADMTVCAFIAMTIILSHAFLGTDLSRMNTLAQQGRHSNVIMMAGKKKGGGGVAQAKPRKGFGAGSTTAAIAAPKAPAFDGPTALRISEAAFDRYEDQAAQDPDSLLFRDFIVCAKVKGGAAVAAAPQLSDWVPCAQLGLLSSATSPVDQMVPVTAAVASLCREVVTAATTSVPSLLTRVPHAHLEYAVEPTDCWMKWVYETVVEERKGGAGAGGRGGEPAVTRADAWGVLGVEPGASAGEVKRAYLKLARDLHPDALVGREPEEIAEAEARFLLVTKSYELVGGGLGGGSDVGATAAAARASWYESIGGKGRTEFATVNLAGQRMGSALLGAEMELNLGGWRAAVRGLDADIVQTFASRNAAAARASLEASR
ncbi:hypothetical protein JKP88DRAFT_263574 [Tribonema minus]|uniref:J domain-containing protein n=1 Tax=Tribonema minus TaxID=303371 RepID=A0A835YUN7_9STRA|nr:hypothetical protein JKP88DRAFT_263574 [Tribonema minus]